MPSILEAGTGISVSNICAFLPVGGNLFFEHCLCIQKVCRLHSSSSLVACSFHCYLFTSCPVVIAYCPRLVLMADSSLVLMVDSSFKNFILFLGNLYELYSSPHLDGWWKCYFSSSFNFSLVPQIAKIRTLVIADVQSYHQNFTWWTLLPLSGPRNAQSD